MQFYCQAKGRTIITWSSCDPNSVLNIRHTFPFYERAHPSDKGWFRLETLAGLLVVVNDLIMQNHHDLIIQNSIKLPVVLLRWSLFMTKKGSSETQVCKC